MPSGRPLRRLNLMPVRLWRLSQLLGSNDQGSCSQGCRRRVPAKQSVLSRDTVGNARLQLGDGD